MLRHVKRWGGRRTKALTVYRELQVEERAYGREGQQEEMSLNFSLKIVQILTQQFYF